MSAYAYDELTYWDAQVQANLDADDEVLSELMQGEPPAEWWED